MKKTKIICSIGPSSCHPDTMEQMVLAGMNVARINFSHATLEEKQGVVASVKEVREKDATKLIEKAVKGMLQHNTLGAQQFTKLKVYAGSEHPHAAQKPIVIEKEAK